MDGMAVPGRQEEAKERKPVSSVALEALYDVQRTMAGPRTARKRQNTIFFRIVRGGDYETAAEIIYLLEEKNMEKEIEWLLNFGGDYDKVSKKGRTGCRRFVCYITAVFYFYLFIIMTPLFYVIHRVACWVESLQPMEFMDIRKVDLPMALAAFSENKNMIALFVRLGVSVCQQDKHGNNVFHTLGTLSRINPSRALAIYKLLVPFSGSRAQLQHAVMNQRNKYQLSALEKAVKEGDCTLYKAMIGTEGVLKRNILSVGNRKTFLASKNAFLEPSSFAELPTMEDKDAPNLDLSFYDVTIYESGLNFKHQSFLLSQLTNQAVEDMTEESVRSLFGSRFLKVWVQSKIRSVRVFTIIKKLWTVAYTVCLLCYIFQSDGDHDLRPMEFIYQKAKLQISGFNQKENIEILNLNLSLTQSSENVTTCKPNYLTLDNNVSLDYCEAQALYSVRQMCPPNIEIIDLLAACGMIHPPEINFNALRILRIILLTLSLLEILVDFVCRILFIYQCFEGREGDPVAFTRRLFSRSLPGSYVQKQLVLSSAFFFVCFSTSLHFINYNLNPAAEEVLYNRRLSSFRGVQMMFCLMLRFIDLLFTLRLLQSVGNFVITTFRMATHLARFVMVYIFVLTPFALIFYFLMRDPSCPLIKTPQFSTLTLSAYETYKIMYGHGDFLFDGKDEVRFAYIVYSIVTILILLNLLIAVMSTTASIGMMNPWRDALHELEHLVEALDSEFLLRIFTFPYRESLHLRRMEGAENCVVHREPELKVFFLVETTNFDEQ